MLYAAKQPVGLPRGLIVRRWLVNRLAVRDGLAGQAGLGVLVEHIGQRWAPCAGVRYAVKGSWGSWLGSLAGLGDKRCLDAASELEITPNRLPWLFVVCILARNGLPRPIPPKNTDRVEVHPGHQICR